ncbi:MAG TPA: ABC transporter ATP-binding protein [Alphaproteobacteria bacterium]|nr:ABC transporter ATP-binding protein [Alphaproteobacteria bacterium]
MAPASVTAPKPASRPVLELNGITKRFGALAANDDITLALGRGEVLGLLGENGAGKSTLMNILAGLILPDAGEILIEGRLARIAAPRDAVSLGIGMVHQHFMIVPTLSVAENIALGNRTLRPLPLDLSGVRAKIRQITDDLGLPLDPDAATARLTVGEQQRVEIVKALSRDARILILDEPTAVLTRDEASGLFDAVKALAQTGVSVILISHKLEDIFAVCDRVAVLRRGRKVHETSTKDTDADGLVLAMVGESITAPAARRNSPPGKLLLELDGVALRRGDGSTAVDGVSFDLHAGEILAVAGIEGNGQRELAEAIAGLQPPEAGRIVYDGKVHTRGTRTMELRRRGLRLVPEDRHAAGMLVDKSLRENQLLSHLHARRYNRAGWLKRRSAARDAQTVIADFDVRATSSNAVMRSLSGGNQQKMVLGRELADGLRLLIAAHPTRGLDVRTIAFIQRQLLDLRDRGIAILLISSDLGEIWQFADRILVFGGGRAHGPIGVTETTPSEIGAWMAGHA